MNPTFTADIDGSYVISLTVNDAEVNSIPDTVTITATSNIVRRYVDANANGAGTGLTPEDAYISIENALSNLPQLGEGQSGEIIIADGNYTASDLTIPAKWLLKGVSQEGVILRSDTERIFINEGTILNCTFTDCYGITPGGAIFNDGGIVQNCTFSHIMEDADGAAVYNKGGTISNCTFDDIGSWCGSSDCPPFDNNAVWGSAGAGVYNENGTVSDCTFNECYAIGEGGGIYNQNGTVNNCTFTNCSTEDGIAGGLFNDGGIVNNCTYINCTP